ncbi:MAG: hypothetical protein AAGC80_14815 [Rhodococcus sp. (in: high G+C Gram-positive bacteria)]
MLIGLSTNAAIPALRTAMLGMAVGYVLLGIVMTLLVRRPAMLVDSQAGPRVADVRIQLRIVGV